MRLVLERGIGESVRIGDDVVLTIVQNDRGLLKLVFDAPPEVKIVRGELAPLGPQPVAYRPGMKAGRK